MQGDCTGFLEYDAIFCKGFEHPASVVHRWPWVQSPFDTERCVCVCKLSLYICVNSFFLMQHTIGQIGWFSIYAGHKTMLSSSYIPECGREGRRRQKLSLSPKFFASYDLRSFSFYVLF